MLSISEFNRLTQSIYAYIEMEYCVARFQSFGIISLPYTVYILDFFFFFCHFHVKLSLDILACFILNVSTFIISYVVRLIYYVDLVFNLTRMISMLLKTL